MPPDKKTIELVARELATEDAFVEKDWYGVQVIAAIATLTFENYQLVFAGGTALCKAHKLIHRFSEDIDFRLQTIGHNPNRKALSIFKDHLVASLRSAGFDIDEERIIARNDNQYLMFYIRYQRMFHHAALRPDIKVEVTLNSPKLPVVALQVSSLISTLTKAPPEVASITCLSYVENAADKLSAAIWRISERVRGGKNDDPTLIRHVYDLAFLKDAVIGDPNFVELARTTIEADSQRTKDHDFAKLSVGQKGGKLISILSEDLLYMEEYQRFVAGLSYASQAQTPDFAKALSALRELLANVA